MADIFDRLGVFGWSRDEEVVALAATLTGEPLLLVGDPGGGKTMLVDKLGLSFGMPYQSFNTAEAQFEDLIGFINTGKLNEGQVEYISTPVSIWGKVIVGLDEINRPDPGQANKYLALVNERQVMGHNTGAAVVYCMMNPYGYEGTSRMGGATIDRMSSFLFLPHFTDMSSGERQAIAKATSNKNLPALKVWNPELAVFYADKTDYKGIGNELRQILDQAVHHYHSLARLDGPIARFLDRFALVVRQKTSAADASGRVNSVKISARRAGMLFRLIKAVYATEMARANALGITPRNFYQSVRYAMRAGLPIGVNNEGGRSPKDMKKIEETINTLLPYLEEDADIRDLDEKYELLTTRDIFRKTELLLRLRHNLNEIVSSSAWTQITQSPGFDATLVATVATQIEALRPGTIPQDALDGLTSLMKNDGVLPRRIVIPPHLRDHQKVLQEYLDQPTLFEKLVALDLVNKMAHQEVQAAEGMGRISLQRSDDATIRRKVVALAQEIKLATERAADLGKVIDELLQLDQEVVTT